LALKLEASDALPTLIALEEDQLLSRILQQKAFDISAPEFLLLLHYEKLELAEQALLTQEFGRTPTCLRSFEVVDKLLQLVGDSRSSLRALWMLGHIFREDWKWEELIRLRRALVGLLAVKEECVLANVSNPLLLSVAATQHCLRISAWALELRGQFLHLAEHFLDFALKLQSQHCFHNLRTLYTERAYGRLCAFDVMAQHTDFFRSLLQQSLVSDVAASLWTGDSRITALGFRSSLLAYHLLGRFGSLQDFVSVPCENNSTRTSLFQYHFWKHNGSLRYWVETLSLLLYYAALIVGFHKYLEWQAELEDPSISPQRLAEVLTMVNQAIRISRYSPLFAGLLALYSLQVWIYKVLLREHYFLSMRTVLDVVQTITAVAIAITQLPDLVGEVIAYNHNLIGEILYATQFAVLAFRVAQILFQTRTFGPVLRMMYVIFLSIRVYLSMYVLCLFAFSLTFTTLFWRVPDFQSLQRTMVTLFAWCIGGPDFSVFEDRRELGGALLILWCFVSAVFVLNLLVAVLSDSYETLSRQANADYVAVIYEHYSQTHYDEEYGSLVLAPAPFNWLVLLCLPLWVRGSKGRKRATELVAVLSYQVFFMLGVVLFLLWGVAVSVGMYAYMLYRVPRALGVRGLLLTPLWLVLGPIYLCTLLLLSLRQWVHLMYAPVQENTLESDYSLIRLHCEHIRRVCKQNFLPLDSLALTWCRFPGKHTSFLSSLDSTLLRSVAERIYFSKKTLLDSRELDIAEVFEQFKSYSPDSDEVGQGLVDVRRLLYWMRVLPAAQLRATNVFYAQKALWLAHEERERMRKQISS
jgi:hypothetical protein